MMLRFSGKQELLKGELTTVVLTNVDKHFCLAEVEPEFESGAVRSQSP